VASSNSEDFSTNSFSVSCKSEFWSLYTVEIKSELETQIEQLSEEKAQQYESALAKIQTLQDENNDLVSKYNNTQESATAKIQTLEDENNNLVSKCNDTQSKLEKNFNKNCQKKP
jgi:predicted  nucleic acid-binding Zn-ribbon protein